MSCGFLSPLPYAVRRGGDSISPVARQGRREYEVIQAGQRGEQRLLPDMPIHRLLEAPAASLNGSFPLARPLHITTHPAYFDAPG